VRVIVPPAVIGMLGGGQLGRYALTAARTMGYGTIVLDPDPNAPAGRVADQHLVAAYDDESTLDVLARRCAVVTTEFENPPAAALRRLADAVRVAPSPAAVEVAQDRLVEKAFLRDHGFAVAPFARLVAPADLGPAGRIATPAILKTARLGYDGKGQRAVEHAGELDCAWADLGRVPCIVEQRVALDLELSAIVARTAGGVAVVGPIAENEHRHGILDVTVVPARIERALADEAVAVAVAVAEALDFVGVLAVELFVSQGRLLVNELAPRPHNSGHWSLDAARTDQFAQQIRAVTGAGLGDPSLTVGAAAMVNLLGDLWFGPAGSDEADDVRETTELGGSDRAAQEPDWSGVLAEPNARLHLYGKTTPRRGRKMGHVTVLGDTVDEVEALARRLRERVAPRWWDL